MLPLVSNTVTKTLLDFIIVLCCVTMVISSLLSLVAMVTASFSQVVTFPAASGADQSIDVPIPIVNNEIALEDDLVRRFGLRDLSTTLVTIGTPSETEVTIVDEDGEWTCTHTTGPSMSPSTSLDLKWTKDSCAESNYFKPFV